jgi:hypothetical protein
VSRLAWDLAGKLTSADRQSICLTLGPDGSWYVDRSVLPLRQRRHLLTLDRREPGLSRLRDDAAVRQTEPYVLRVVLLTASWGPLRWLAVRLDMIGAILILVVALLVAVGPTNSPAQVGLLLTYTVSLVQMLGCVSCRLLLAGSSC